MVCSCFGPDEAQRNSSAPWWLIHLGGQKDLGVVTRWFKDKLPADQKGYPWDIGYTGTAVCEYYLRTGDKSVLPAIKSLADELTRIVDRGNGFVMFNKFKELLAKAP